MIGLIHYPFDLIDFASELDSARNAEYMTGAIMIIDNHQKRYQPASVGNSNRNLSPALDYAVDRRHPLTVNINKYKYALEMIHKNAIDENIRWI